MGEYSYLLVSEQDSPHLNAMCIWKPYFVNVFLELLTSKIFWKALFPSLFPNFNISFPFLWFFFFLGDIIRSLLFSKQTRQARLDSPPALHTPKQPNIARKHMQIHFIWWMNCLRLLKVHLILFVGKILPCLSRKNKTHQSL